SSLRAVGAAKTVAVGAAVAVLARAATLALHKIVGRAAARTLDVNGVGTKSGCAGLGSISSTRTRALSIFKSSQSPAATRTNNMPAHRPLNSSAVKLNHNSAGRTSVRLERRCL